MSKDPTTGLDGSVNVRGEGDFLSGVRHLRLPTCSQLPIELASILPAFPNLRLLSQRQNACRPRFDDDLGYFLATKALRAPLLGPDASQWPARPFAPPGAFDRLALDYHASPDFLRLKGQPAGNTNALSTP
jgi:hypothetical protein